MNTRVARYCDRVMEAGWLAAAVLTPLFFNIYSSRVFEPDKLTLLRSVALVVACAWLIRTMAQGRPVAAVRMEDDKPRAPLAAAWQALTATPLMLPVLLLVLVYLFSSALSVVPRTSFWGSYQRLQGTYTLLAYIVIFLAVWQNLRTRAQLDRLLNVIVLTSLPVALYGILQRYGLDPLPWAGDVVARVTGNLGNAIFIAAYLIMAFFITLERSVARFRRLLSAEGGSLADSFAGGAFLFILVVQAVAIYFSQSRGPWLGLLAGGYVFVFVALVAMRQAVAAEERFGPLQAAFAVTYALSSPLLVAVPLHLGMAWHQVTPLGLLGVLLFVGAYLALVLARRGRSWLWLSWFIHGVLVVILLFILNLPSGPLAPLRSIPGVGRLGQVFETETGTGRVRVLIWEGTIDLLKSDPWRAVVGYGPESMYVAFNPHYPVDLAHHESRTASPDRAHNETFDALVNTGLIGFLVYLGLFVGIFQWGLRWLGFLPGRGRRGWRLWLYLVLAIAGAILGVVYALLVDHSLRFAGVGIPVGLLAGVAVFLAVSGAAGPPAGERAGTFGARELLLAGLLAMIVAHYVEIHFGIAIAATRLYFWIGLALLISAGSGRLSLEPVAEAPVAPRPAPALMSSKRRRREARLAALPPRDRAWPYSSAVAAGLLGALLLGTLAYDFVTNMNGRSGILPLIWQSLTAIAPAGQAPRPALGGLALLLMTWLLGTVLLVGEAENADRPPPAGWWPRALAWYLATSLLVPGIFALIHTSRLQPGTDIALVIFFFYAFVLALLFVAASFLPRRPQAAGPPQAAPTEWRAALATMGSGLLILMVSLLIVANILVVEADIYYKQAWEGLHKPAFSWFTTGSMDRATIQRYYSGALMYYDKAVNLAPEEDYYLLFRGKAYVELAEASDTAEAKQYCLSKAEQDLKRARALNPLNTDHTANLARMYRVWAEIGSDDATRQVRLADSARYYGEAAKLSPHNVVLLNEWARTLMDAGQSEQGLAVYEQSLALDSTYAQTYLLLGDYYEGREDLPKAVSYYEQGAEVDPRASQIHSKLGYLYSQMGRYTEAISQNLAVLAMYPNDYSTNKNLAILYGQTGQAANALAAATAARQAAPQQDQAALDTLIAELQAALQQGSQP